MKMKFVVALAFLLSGVALADDPDTAYICKAVADAPCADVQVLIAHNIGVVRWTAGGSRYLYGDDIAPLRAAEVGSGKRPIDLDQDLPIPNLNDPNWPTVEEQLHDTLEQLFAADRLQHPNCQ
jgi:hypothetical protein